MTWLGGLSCPRFIAGKLFFGCFLTRSYWRLPPSGEDVAEQVADGLTACQFQAARGDDGVAGGVVAGDADGHGEGDPVRVDTGLPGGFGFQGA